MSKVAASLYDDTAREKCYTCPNSGSGQVKVKGQEHLLECRAYTEIGNATETRMTAMETDIFTTGLIDIVPIGVDDARLNFGTAWKFKTRSKGTGGLDKYDCATDFQIPEIIKHDKIGFTNLLYVHYKGCPKKYISTELQDMVYERDSYQDSYDPDNALSDKLMAAARASVAESVQYTDIVGIYQGADEKANHYDGILAQAYWAYTGKAYYHSLQFMIDEECLIDGTYIHAKYAGCAIDICFDSSQETNEDLESYSTRAEVYERLVDWLNNEVVTASGRKYVDATYINNNIIVTSKWSEDSVCLDMFVDEKETVESWAACDIYTGVKFKTLQACMPIDERPVLVEYKKYTKENIIYQLPCDIHDAQMELDNTLLEDGQEMCLFIDKYVWMTYTNALKTRKQDATAYDLRDDFTVNTLDALSAKGGTGIWFLSACSNNEAQRNIAHLIDVQRNDTDDIFIGMADNTCREMVLLYDILHGVMFKDLRKFASNLLCSPFVKGLKGDPQEKTRKLIPCYNKKVRSTFIDPSTFLDNCKINAGFERVEEYKNAALYALNGEIKTLEAGETLPAGAEPVYEIEFRDLTVGIPNTVAEEVLYEYTFTTSDGVQLINTGKDPIFQYLGSAAGTTFNVSQTVILPDGCTSTYNASDHYPEDFPFECRGGCDNVEVSMSGRIDEKATGITIEPTFAEDGETTVVTSEGDIVLTAGSDIATAVEQINAWLVAGAFTAIAAVEGTSILITGTDLTFNTFNGVEFSEVNSYCLELLDSTTFDEGDGIGSVEIFVYEVGGTKPAEATFTELPEGEAIEDFSANGWTVEVSFKTSYGCTFEGLAADAILPKDDDFISFELA